ncbi:MAG: HAMP domain-containing histidine kinase [Clostridia bacterium]|nr:HAMP domain-containing histidine kinase [Clostridia bacterium]
MKNFKEKRSPKSNMRLIFTILVMAEFIIVSVASWALSLLLEKVFGIDFKFNSILWIIFLSICIGGAVTVIISKKFFDPITRLGQAMSRVAKGDFSVRLEPQRDLKEIERIYSDFNAMAKELGATEILQTDFVSNVSHEFKTPINAIEGYATLLQGGGTPVTDEQAVYVEKILFNTKRLSSLVGNILLLSKVDNQGIIANETRFRLDEQIRQSLVVLEPEWEKKEIELDVELETLEYYGNESLLLHVWNNIIGNAIKFDPVGGIVRIRLKQEDGCAVCTVEDNGPGISAEDKKHIFDKFYQSDSSHKEEGNGLGLSLVKQIVSIYNGSIDAENPSEVGCRFTVRLPLSLHRVKDNKKR